MELSTGARRRLSTVLALVLAAESVSMVSVAAASVGAQGRVSRAGAEQAVAAQAAPLQVSSAVFARTAVVAPAGAATAPRFTPRAVETPERPAGPAAVAEAPDGDATDGRPAAAPKGDAELRARLPEAVAAPAAAPAAPASKGAGTASGPSHAKPAPRPATFSGTNHVWIPALGISRSVHWFPCDRTRPPDNLMYRWGCAGANNVYLMGHAYSVMKPLHDAYVSGHLRVGMKAYYAGGDGKVHAYAVRWWKLTRPTTDAAWAWAAQSVPSMTLQTCVGANSEWRLMVRLVEVSG